MEVTAVSTPDGSLLPAVREALGDADEARLCVAFVGMAGVHLVEKELKGLGGRAQLLATTVFGSTSIPALQRTASLGVHVRTLNPAGGGTYHPKLYIGRFGDRARAVVGSANLTGGLVSNVEVGCVLDGPMEAPTLARLWTLATDLWDDAKARPWSAPATEPTASEGFDNDLRPLLVAELDRDAAFLTLGPTPRRNRVTDMTPEGLYVETDRTKAQGRPPQLVPAWMLNMAWDYLRTHGELTNSFLLNELRVHRSSFVCATLARLPGVEEVEGAGIRLVWRKA